MKKKLQLTIFTFFVLAVSAFATGLNYIYNQATTGEVVSIKGFEEINADPFSFLNNEINEDTGPIGAEIQKEIAQINKVLNQNIKSAKKSFNYRKRVVAKKQVVATNIKTVRANKVLTNHELNTDELINLDGFEMTTHMGDVNWLAYIDEKLKIKENVIKVAELSTDKISTKMSSLDDKELIEPLSFEEEKAINEMVNNLSDDDLKTVSKANDKNDDLMFIDYSEDDLEKKLPSVEVNIVGTSPAKIISQKKINITNFIPDLVGGIKIAQNSATPVKELMKYKMGKRDDSSAASKNPVSTQKDKLISAAMATQGPVSLSLTKQKKASLVDPLKNPALLALKKDIRKFKKTDKLTRTIIKVTDAKINSSINSSIAGFQFSPEYDPNERWNDEGTGSVEVVEKLNNDLSVLRGTILAKNKMRTKVDIALEEGDYQVDIPLIDQSFLNKFLDNEKLEGLNGFLLIDLDEEIDSVDIDSGYERKLFLTSKFKVTSQEEDYRYILYVGVEPGNTLVHYLTLKDENIQKIVHITEGEVYFEGTVLLSSKLEKIELYETKLLGKSKMELNIEGEDISYFNTNIKAKSIGLNLYQYRRPKLLLGMRKYLELSHLGESIYLGVWDKLKAEVPSRDYIEYIMNTLDLESLDTRCLIQVNFNKKLTDFYASGETFRGAMNVEMAFLEKDGMFNEEVTDLTTKAYLVGDMQGVINAKISYEDGSVDIIQSYCSQDTFLVEQL